MKYFLSSLLVLLFGACAFAQDSIVVAQGTAFIATKQFAEADHYLDSVLKKQPKNVDALMMKGNVALNRDLYNMPAPDIYLDDDESIFNDAADINTANRKIVTPETVTAVEAYWDQCLKLDPKRVDIKKGLCTVYAMALLKDKLEKEMEQVKKEEKDDGEQCFRMAEYARKFKERGRFDDAMDIYRFVANLYPSVAGIRCDMASEYFYAGRLEEALTWLDSTYNFKSVDETSFLNGAFVYSELGLFDNAQNVLNTYSHIYNRKMDQFYYGLREFADTTPAFADVLNYFVNTVDSNAYYTEYQFARQLLLFSPFTPAAYQSIISNNWPPYYKVFIYQRGITQFPTNCEPYILYGGYANSIKNYEAAAQYLAEGENCHLNAAQARYWMLNYAFALYHSGDRDKALLYFKPLFTNDDAFTAQAAMYFTAKVYLSQSKINDARTLLQQIIDSKEKTRYGILAAYLLKPFK